MLLFLLILFFFPTNLFAQNPPDPAWINDGPGDDVDYWTDTDSFSCNWAAIVWPDIAADREKKYTVELYQDTNEIKLVDIPNSTGTIADPPTEAQFLIDGGLTEIDGYYVKIVAKYAPLAGGWIDAPGNTVSDGFVVDATPPTAAMAALTAVQESSSFTVSWSGSDNLSGIDHYRIEYSAGGGPWQAWFAETTASSALFNGSNGQDYRFRVRAADRAGNIGSYSAEVSTEINVIGASLDLSAAASSLHFGGSETLKNLQLELTAAGSGSVTVESIQEDRIFTGYPVYEGFPETLSMTLPASSSASFSRQVSLTAAERSRALGSSQQGGFDLRYTVRGRDAYGDPVSGQVTVPVTVDSAPPLSLTIGSVSVELPLGPYFAGETVDGGRIRVVAAGSGTVEGEITVSGPNGPVAWTSSPAFSASVSGTTNINIADPLPTTDTGTYTVRVDIDYPELFSAEAEYTVSDSQSPFTPNRIVLIPGAAELSSLSGSAIAVNDPNGQYVQYNFSGAASLDLPGMNGLSLPDAEVSGLIIRYYNNDPAAAYILGGEVEKSADPADPAGLFAAAGGNLKVRSLRFTGSSDENAPTEYLQADAVLTWASQSRELCMLEGIRIGAEGVAAGSYQTDSSFELFGKIFSLQETYGEAALEIIPDTAGGYVFRMAGELLWREKSGASVNQVKLTDFTGLELSSAGGFAFDYQAASYELIPGKVSFQRFFIDSTGADPVMVCAGRVSGLDYPLAGLDEEFSLNFAVDGSVSGSAVLLDELSGSASRSPDDAGSDQSQWLYEVALVDCTYISADLVFIQDGILVRDQSLLNLGVDVYLNLRGADRDPTPEERRAAFGELSGNGTLSNPVSIDLDGEAFWPPPTGTENFTDKRFDVTSIFTLELDSIAVDTQEEFKFRSAGQIVMDFPLVDGGAAFNDLEIGLSGSVAKGSNESIEGEFDMLEVVQVNVGDIEWGGQTTLEFNTDDTSGEGENRSLGKGTKQVAVDSYFRLSGAEIQLGDTGKKGESLIGGSFESLTVYKPTDGNKSFVLEDIDANLYYVKLKDTDIEYLDSFLRFSGTVKIIPKDIEADVVGKAGTENGKPTFGLFVLARKLEIQVYPNVYLDEVGGGFFLNPNEDDLALVRNVANFSNPAPTLMDKIDSFMPAGAADPGSFALMLVGGAYISDRNVVQGRAMITITENRIEFDADVKCLKKVLKGSAHLVISWDPGYAYGAVEVELDVLKILTGSGSLDFYIFDLDTWGISGDYNISLLAGLSENTGRLFLGPPGFMVSTYNETGLDIGIVKGGLSFEALFWYHNRSGEKDSWGAYAKTEIWGELLWGLFSGRAGLEGALIGSPRFIVYVVGSLKVKVLGVKVFDGSIWVSFEAPDRLDGGKGRNEEYDGIIEDARNMADEMNQAMDELADELDAAKDTLAQLSDAQRQAAGQALVERSGFVGALVEFIFDYNELQNWGQNRPAVLNIIYQQLFGPAQDGLVQARSELQAIRGDIDQALTRLQALHQEVKQNFARYSDLIVEDLPTIQDLGIGGNPFGGMQTEVVNVGGTQMTVETGFTIDYSQADAQKEALTAMQDHFAEFQEAFIEQAGIIDAKLQELDRILYSDENNLTALNELHARIYRRLSSYIHRFAVFQDENAEYAQQSLDLFDSQGVENLVEISMQNKANQFSAVNTNLLSNWNSEREQLINALISTGGGEVSYLEDDGQTPTTPEQTFIVKGKELWYEIPRAGFEAARDNAPLRANAAVSAFRSSSIPYREQWGQATDWAEQVYARKSDLYDILWEIYDQLAFYGSGMIAIESDGSASGFKGIAADGLAFRSTAASRSISVQAEPLPEGAVEPDGPVVGPFNPVQPNLQQGIYQQGVVPQGQMQQMQFPRLDDSDSGRMSRYFKAGRMDARTVRTAVLEGLSKNSAGSQEAESGDIYRSSAAEGTKETSIEKPAPIENLSPELLNTGSSEDSGTALSYVAVQSYFEQKREELEPYTEFPVITTLDGSLLSDSPESALLDIGIDADHAVSVVEYSFRVSSVPLEDLEQAIADASANQTFTAMVQNQVPAVTPWLSLGSISDYDYRFFGGSGLRYLYVRARGAGGKSTVRRAGFTVDYFDPGTDSAPVSSAIDTGDDTAPAGPFVELAGPYASSTAGIYAEWTASDPESGITGYEYAVSTAPAAVADGAGQTAAADQAVSAQMQGTTGIMEAILGGGTSDPPGMEELPEAPDILGWTDAGGRTEVNIRGLSLQHNEEYVVHVRATNGVGFKNIGTSDPVRIDTTPPDGPPILSFSQVTSSGYPNSFRFEFGPGSDAESGIERYLIALGTEEGGEDFLSWTEAETGIHTVINVPVLQDTVVYLSVRAENGAGLGSSGYAQLSASFQDPSPPPQTTVVTEPHLFTAAASDLEISWDEAEDPESGIYSYQYGIGTSPSVPNVLSWTEAERPAAASLAGESAAVEQAGTKQSGETQPNGSGSGRVKGSFGFELDGYRQWLEETGSYDHEITIEDPDLSGGGTYYILVRAVNGAGLVSVSSSEPLVFDTSPPAVISLSAPAQSDTSGLTVRLQARDDESGIRSYRYAVWDMDAQSSLIEPGLLGEPEAETAGFVSDGQFQTGVFSQGTQFEGGQGQLPAGITDGGGQFDQFDDHGQDPQFLEEIMNLYDSLPPWIESGWETVSGGALPQSIDLTVVIRGFPRSLAPGRRYRVAFWVKNGAGTASDSEAAVIILESSKSGSSQPSRRSPGGLR